MTAAGWGFSEWGSAPWGGFEGAAAGALQLVEAYAVAENVVRLEFSLPVAFTGVGGAGDAADPDAYTIEAVGGQPNDGKPVRPVAVVLPQLAAPAIVDLQLDRPMSPYAALYRVTVAGVQGEGGADLDPAASSLEFFGCCSREDFALTATQPSRDFAHPDTLSAQLDPLPATGTALLGGLPLDASADYACDEGLVSYRKRVWRRVLAKRDGYAHLPGYGGGLLQQVKRLARGSERQRIASELEVQILREPETLRCRCRFVPGATPGLWRLVILAQTKSWGATKMEQDLATGN